MQSQYKDVHEQTGNLKYILHQLVEFLPKKDEINRDKEIIIESVGKHHEECCYGSSV
jgi:hypothetical protein